MSTSSQSVALEDTNNQAIMTEQQQQEVSNETDNNEESDSIIQLGFSVKIDTSEQLQLIGHRQPDYNQWDGGQLGGVPVWLNPVEIPTGPLLCLTCDSQMRFLCQLYAPLDDFTTDDNDNDADNADAGATTATDRAFHRSLYVFGCPCCAKESVGSVRVLRSQLPEENPYYPTFNKDDDDSIIEEVNWQQHTPAYWNNKVSLCAVCGLAATTKCPLQHKFFCCKEHQKEYKQFVFDVVMNGGQSSSNGISSMLHPPQLPSVYNRSELAVEEEPVYDKDSDAAATAHRDALFEAGDIDDSDSDEDLEQDDLNRMVGAEHATTQDAATTYFYQRVKERTNCRNQCLRYDRWPVIADGNESNSAAPLWIRQDLQPTDIPDCPHCQAPRRFEFQLMPQLLHYLLQGREKQSTQATQDYEKVKAAVEQADSLVQQAPPEHVPPALVDAKDAAVKRMKEQVTGGTSVEIDWGVVAVYTCTKSCSNSNDAAIDAGLGSCREEYAWKQPSLDV